MPNVSKPDILCVTETWFRPWSKHVLTPWFRPSSTNNSIHNSGYSLFRKLRHENREGGGVCIFY